MVDSMDTSTEAHRGETGGTDGSALDATGVYETREGVVLYDSEEPLAWIQADHAVRLDDAV